MPTNVEKARIEKESEMIINESENFEDILTFTGVDYHRRVRIMALWKLTTISQTRSQREVVYLRSVKYDDIDLQFKALSNLYDILTDPLDVESYFSNKHKNNPEFQSLRIESLTKTLKCVIDKIDLRMVADYLKIPGTNDAYKQMLNDKILALLAESDMDGLLAVLNKPNVTDAVNSSIWQEVVRMTGGVSATAILEIVKNNKLKLSSSQVYDLLKILCNRIDELSILQTYKVFLIACNRQFRDIKDFLLIKIESLLPGSEVADIVQICKTSVSGTRINKLTLSLLRDLMLKADPDEAEIVYHQSIGSKELNELMGWIVQRNSSDIKIGSL